MDRRPLTPEQVDDLMSWVSRGNFVTAWCRIPGNPGKDTVYGTIAESPELQARMIVARSMGADAIAEETLDIADGVGRDKDTSVTVGRDKLRVDQRTRLLAKWNSGRYGDKSAIEHSGATTIQVVTGIPPRES